MATKYEFPRTETMINKLKEFQRLSFLADQTIEEQAEMNQLQQELVTYMITPTDFNTKVDRDDYIKVPEYKSTSGTSTAYTITLTPAIDTLTEGDGFVIKPHVNSGLNPKLKVSNAASIAIVKPNGNAAKLYKDAIYSVRYNGVNFQLLGEGGEYGNATIDKVLSPFTIGTENGIVTGTMPDIGSIDEVITTQNGEIIISEGYHDGTGKITSLFINNIPENIKNGINIGGVIGTATVARQRAIADNSQQESKTFSSVAVNTYKNIVMKFNIGGVIRSGFYISASFISGYGGTIIGDYAVLVNSVTKVTGNINEPFEGVGDINYYSGFAGTFYKDVSINAGDIVEFRLRWTGNAARITNADLGISLHYLCAATVDKASDYTLL